MKFLKEAIKELGLRDKMELHHWFLEVLLQDLNADIAGDSKHVTAT